MPFWNQPEVEPKRSFRWVLRIPGETEADQIPSWICKTVKKPSFSITEVTTQFVAHTFYYPGRITWDATDVTIIDPVTPDASANLVRILQKSGYTLPASEALAMKSFSREASTRAVGNAQIDQIDADGTTIDQWTLVNTWVTKVAFGDLDYSSEEMVNITLTLRYDFAEFGVRLTSGGPIEPVLYGGTATDG